MHVSHYPTALALSLDLDHGSSVGGCEVRGRDFSDLLIIEWSFLISEVQAFPVCQLVSTLYKGHTK